MRERVIDFFLCMELFVYASVAIGDVHVFEPELRIERVEDTWWFWPVRVLPYFRKYSPMGNVQLSQCVVGLGVCRTRAAKIESCNLGGRLMTNELVRGVKFL